MSFPQAVIRCLRRYADFSGRARPAEFWWFTLLVVGAFVAGTSLDSALGTDVAGYGVLANIAVLALLLPQMAVGARRLHDSGRSGLWLLLYLVPCGGIALIMWFVQECDDDNRYGPSPLRGSRMAETSS